jgi:hypothetical protein
MRDHEVGDDIAAGCVKHTEFEKRVGGPRLRPQPDMVHRHFNPRHC